MLAPQAQTAVPLQWSRHYRSQRMQGSRVLSGRLPDVRQGTSEPQSVPATFGTAVCALGSCKQKLIKRRRISWRVQIRAKATTHAAPSHPFAGSSACRTADNSAGVEVGDLHTGVGSVASGTRARSPRRSAIRPRSDRAPWWTPCPQPTCGARYRERRRTSRHRRCARPHPVISMEFAQLARRDELTSKEVRYGCI